MKHLIIPANTTHDSMCVNSAIVALSPSTILKIIQTSTFITHNKYPELKGILHAEYNLPDKIWFTDDEAYECEDGLSHWEEIGDVEEELSKESSKVKDLFVTRLIVSKDSFMISCYGDDGRGEFFTESVKIEFIKRKHHETLSHS